MRMKATATGKCKGVAYFDAETEAEADEKSRALKDTDFEWEPVTDDFSVERVEKAAPGEEENDEEEEEE